MERGSKVQRWGRVDKMEKGSWVNKMGRGNA